MNMSGKNIGLKKKRSDSAGYIERVSKFVKTIQKSKFSVIARFFFGFSISVLFSRTLRLALRVGGAEMLPRPGMAIIEGDIWFFQILML
jgi:hypothetical protein